MSPVRHVDFEKFCSARNPNASLQGQHSYMKNIPAGTAYAFQRNKKAAQDARLSSRLIQLCQFSCGEISATRPW
jgi:hypothetical protein